MGLKVKRDEDGKFDINYKLFDVGFVFHILALLISWATNKSIIWTIVHYVFGFLYVIYWAITGDNANEEGIKSIFHYYKSLFE